MHAFTVLVPFRNPAGQPRPCTDRGVVPAGGALSEDWWSQQGTKGAPVLQDVNEVNDVRTVCLCCRFGLH